LPIASQDTPQTSEFRHLDKGFQEVYVNQQDLQTQLNDLHRRFDALERVHSESNRRLSDRVSRGFLSVKRDGQVPSAPVNQSPIEIDYEQIKQVLESERKAFQKVLPGELIATMQRLKRFLWVISFLLFVSFASNLVFFYLIRTDVIQRTPTSLQIEMMRQGWNHMRSKEVSDDQPSHR
jgi:hypothetical protein